MDTLFHFFKDFYGVFSFSFLVALTGAMSPGPLLTYTIIKSAQTNKRGYLMGFWIITGHAALEGAIIVFLLLGFSFVLKNMFIVRAIGVVGGIVLVYFGSSIIRNVYLDKIPTGFLNGSKSADPGQQEDHLSGLNNPIIGGIIVSMSNPYWWVWWATIGFAFMVQFNISFQNWTKLFGFFLGHEAGDLAWYVFISALTFFGIRYLNKKMYYGILVLCSIFMMLFGLYLGFSPFFKSGMS